MKQKKAFFVTFFITLLIMLAAFGALYLSLDVKPKETDKAKAGIAIKQPGIDDSKTILLCAGQEDCQFFFLIKFNALQNKISIMSISPSYTLEKTGRSLTQSMEKAGMLQCVYDLKNEFSLTVDYYLHCDWDTLALVFEEFSDFGVNELGENLPESVKNILLKGAEKLDVNSLINIAKTAQGFLDNQVGLGFLNESAYVLIKYNLPKLSTSAPQKIEKNYSRMNTSLNVISLEKLKTIINFLVEGEADYARDIIVNDEPEAQKKIDALFKE